MENVSIQPGVSYHRYKQENICQQYSQKYFIPESSEQYRVRGLTIPRGGSRASPHQRQQLQQLLCEYVHLAHAAPQSSARRSWYTTKYEHFLRRMLLFYLFVNTSTKEHIDMYSSIVCIEPNFKQNLLVNRHTFKLYTCSIVVRWRIIIHFSD